jgi:hypothetical protein
MTMRLLNPPEWRATVDHRAAGVYLKSWSNRQGGQTWHSARDIIFI